MNHRAFVTVIPIPEWNSWHEILLVNETRQLLSKKTSITVTEVVQPYSGLAEAIRRLTY